jgi:hypothetical protein
LKTPGHSFFVANLDVQHTPFVGDLAFWYSAILHPFVLRHVDLQLANVDVKHLMLYPKQIGPASAPQRSLVPGRVGAGFLVAGFEGFLVAEPAAQHLATFILVRA